MLVHTDLSAIKFLHRLHLWASPANIACRETHWGLCCTVTAYSLVQMEIFTRDSGAMVSGREQGMLFSNSTNPMMHSNQSQSAMTASGRKTGHMGESSQHALSLTLQTKNCMTNVSILSGICNQYFNCQRTPQL